MDKLDYLRRWRPILKPVEELDYLRRWWIILTAALIIGAVAGMWYSQEFGAKPKIEAAAQLRVERIDFKIVSVQGADAGAAAESLFATAAYLETLINAPVELHDLSIREVENLAWKRAVFGGVLAIIVAIGAIWVIEQIRGEYQKSGPTRIRD